MLTARRAEARPPSLDPALVVEVELLEGVPALPGPAPDGPPRGTAMCVARLGGAPVGVAWVGLGAAGVRPEELAALLWDACAPVVTERARAAGLTPPLTLAPDGLRDRRGRARRALADPPRPVPPPAAVVVATRDRPRLLAACLDTLLAQSHRPHGIVVVDNASRDDAAERLVRRRYAGRGVRLMREDRPGLAHAHNRALALVTAPVVAFLDDDVLADREWLARIAAPFAADERVGCVTGIILPRRLDTPAQVWFERRVGLGKGFLPLRADPRGARIDPLLPVATGRLGSGASMAFDTALLRAIGGFDPLLGAGTPRRGGDDLAAFFDVLVRDRAVVYAPDAVVWHDHHSQPAALRRAMEGYGVGLGAHLARCVLERPGASLAAAVRALLLRGGGGSARRRLTAAERRGVGAGAARYLLARAGVGR